MLQQSEGCELVKSDPPLLWLTPAGMLCLAMLRLPFGYYELLRLIVCVAAAWITYRSFSLRQSQSWAVVFALIGILFNPVIPIHLTRAIWFWLDIGGAALFLVHLLIVRKFPDYILSKRGSRDSL